MPKKKAPIGTRPLMCGGCGAVSFRLYQGSPQGYSGPARLVSGLVAECKKCGSTTLIGVEPAKIALDWGVDSEGILCIAKSEKEES